MIHNFKKKAKRYALFSRDKRFAFLFVFYTHVYEIFEPFSLQQQAASFDKELIDGIVRDIQIEICCFIG